MQLDGVAGSPDGAQQLRRLHAVDSTTGRDIPGDWYEATTNARRIALQVSSCPLAPYHPWFMPAMRSHNAYLLRSSPMDPLAWCWQFRRSTNVTSYAADAYRRAHACSHSASNSLWLRSRACDALFYIRVIQLPQPRANLERGSVRRHGCVRCRDDLHLGSAQSQGAAGCSRGTGGGVSSVW